jgi:hypothetical protein
MCQNTISLISLDLFVQRIKLRNPVILFVLIIYEMLTLSQSRVIIITVIHFREQSICYIYTVYIINLYQYIRFYRYVLVLQSNYLNK